MALIGVHTQKFYRVVLEGIDPKMASPESFSIKLALRTRTALPRVRQVLRNLPCAIKRGLDANQANRLKSVLESIGGRARLETYFVTPGREETSEGHLQVLATEPEVVATRVCPLCGWEDEIGAKHCSFCLEPASGSAGGPSPEPEMTEEAPVEETPPAAAPPKPSRPVVRETPARAPGIGTMLWENRFLVAAGVLLVFLLIAILK
jgi:hypothetical protein